MQSDSSSIDTLQANLLRAVDADYNVMKAETVLNVIRQLEQIQITKEQLQTTRLGREINTIRQKIALRKKNIPIDEQCSSLIIEIAHRAKKLLRSWQGLLNTSSSSSSSSIDSSSNTSTPTNVIDSKPRLILKVKFHSPITKRKRDSDSHVIHGTKVKRRKTQPIGTTEELFREMQTHQPTVLLTRTSAFNAMFEKQMYEHTLPETGKSALISDKSNWQTGSDAGSPLSSSSSSVVNSPLSKTEQPSTSDLATICASYNTVADLVKDHRQRILIEHDSRALEARPDLLLVPIDQLALVYEREQMRDLPAPLPSKAPYSMTTIEKLSQPSELIALPFIDCPFDFDLILDELVVVNPLRDV